MRKILFLFLLALISQINVLADEKAEAVVKKAVNRLGGERYLAVKTIVGRGNFTFLSDKPDALPLPQAFVDYVVFPNKGRTEFKTGGVRIVQANVDETGWIADGGARMVKDQTPEQIAEFKRSVRVSLDNLLRGGWRTDAKLEYVGRREAGVGKRNEVVRLTYADGLAVEFEFAATDGTPAKIIYKRQNAEGEPTIEEDRFALFVETNGVFAPFVIDHYRNGRQTSKVNYESIEYNAAVPDALFVKPADIKKLK